MMILVGDVLKKTSAVFGDGMWDVEDFSRSMWGSDSLSFYLLVQRSIASMGVPVSQLAFCLNPIVVCYHGIVLLMYISHNNEHHGSRKYHPQFAAENRELYWNLL